MQDLRPGDYTYTLTAEDVAEIIAGTDAILAGGVKDEEDIKKVGRHTVINISSRDAATAVIELLCVTKAPAAWNLPAIF
jgi:N-acetylmuramic acid 6-phosphate (MurNAc-6-P) etherase